MIADHHKYTISVKAKAIAVAKWQAAEALVK